MWKILKKQELFKNKPLTLSGIIGKIVKMGQFERHWSPERFISRGKKMEE